MRKAICLGVSAQTDASLTSLPQCESDINLLSNFLASDLAKFNVEKIHNPTSTNIKRQLWNVLRNVAPDDQLLIYFSGHGRRNAKRKLQLCLHDTEVDALAVTSISFDELLELCNEAGAESALIMLDCCFSGAAERSILAKGTEEIFVPHEEAILSSKGLSVLSSCSSVELSYTDDTTNLSTFTATLLDICRRKSREISGWLTVGQLYEELRFSVRSHSPKLIGNNPTFPIFKGQSASHTTALQQIELRERIEGYALLYGILVMPYYRAWLVGVITKHLPEDSSHVGRRVHVKYNSQELYTNKINDAKQFIEGTLDELEALADFISTDILLLYPVAIEKQTYDRFQGVDRKYILTTSQELSNTQYPVITQQHYGYTISGSSRNFFIHNVPDDYLREVFGLIVAPNIDTNTLIFREDSFFANAKYLKVEPYTNRILDSLTFGKNLKSSELPFSRTPEEKMQFEATVNYLRTRPTPPPTEVIGGAFIVQSKEQIRKPKEGYSAQCQLCLDEKFRQVSVNNRLYRIPCRACNSSYDNSWRAFPDF